jgi:riboflavin synthase alpha subunit
MCLSKCNVHRYNTVSGHVHTQAKIVEQEDSENNRKVGLYKLNAVDA